MIDRFSNTIVQEHETRLVRMFDDNQVEFPYNGKIQTHLLLRLNLETAAINTAAGLTINQGVPLVLQLFVDGLPGAGIYWLTIKTVGGNKAIQDALTGSDDAPPESLNFCAGFIMVSVSGMGGLSATKGFETFKADW